MISIFHIGLVLEDLRECWRGIIEWFKHHSNGLTGSDKFK
jgi:hypothetical protein